MKRAALVLALAALGAAAHTFAPSRTLTLALRADALTGVLIYRVPAPQVPLVLAAPPAHRDGFDAASLRVLPEAVQGVRVGFDGAAPVAPTAGKARLAADGALEAALWVALPRPRGARTLRVEARGGLPVQLQAPGARLVSGPGAPIEGGLELHPREGAPCVVALQAISTP